MAALLMMEASRLNWRLLGTKVTMRQASSFDANSDVSHTFFSLLIHTVSERRGASFFDATTEKPVFDWLRYSECLGERWCDGIRKYILTGSRKDILTGTTSGILMGIRSTSE